ncbi:hypothetical protein GCM10009839_86810 [Catenulispora yoronensis]|uniref:Uncharacterized protein n=1 Tax=Catenulispora yoronensis TaxID=450799 RepID=A0ABN2VHX8_9ACTN
MPPIAQRLREPAAFVLLAFGAISTLFHSITFLFGPGQNNNGFGGGPSFSDRAYLNAGTLVSIEVVVALLGAVWLAHLQTPLKTAKIVSLIALIAIGVADLFGVVALFAGFGADGPSGWDKTQSFFITVAALAVAGVASWLILGYFQQHAPVRPAGGYGQPQPQGQWGQPQPQGQWGPPPQQQQPPQPQQQWGPPPQQQTAPPQPQWGQPQQSPDADAMMTQAIPTVPPAGQQQPPQQGEGGLPIGNWTAE